MTIKKNVSPEVADIINHGTKDDIISNAGNKKKYLSTKGASQQYDVPEGTLNNWAWKRVGPKFYKIGNRRFYHVDDLDAFFKSNPVLTIDQH